MKKINNKGFTLIELLTTITILAIVLSITLFFGVNLIKNAIEALKNTEKQKQLPEQEIKT